MKPNLDLFHSPTRGSDVEDWLKRHRDRCAKGTPWFSTVDELLDDYRLRADTGLDLDADLDEGEE